MAEAEYARISNLEKMVPKPVTTPPVLSPEEEEYYRSVQDKNEIYFRADGSIVHLPRNGRAYIE